MPNFKVKTLQSYELYYFIEADSEREALEKVKAKGDYYQKAQEELPVRIKKTKMSRERFHEKMNKEGFF